MKEKLFSLFRHAITAIPAAGAAMAANGWLTADEGATLDADLTTFLVSLAAILAGVLTRWIMAIVAKHAPHLSNIFGGPSGGAAAAVAMTAVTWGAFSMAGALLMSSCSVGVDSAGGWSIRPDPLTIDAGLKYLIRHEDDAKSGLTEWEYFDPSTGEQIKPEDYAAWGIKP